MEPQADRHARTLAKLKAHHAKRIYLATEQPKSQTVRAKIAAHLEASRQCWLVLHSYPIEHWGDWNEQKAKAWLAEWEGTIPRYGCACRKHWRGIKRDLPPMFGSAKCFFQWSVAAHNAVNAEIGKPTVSQEEAISIYLPRDSLTQ